MSEVIASAEIRLAKNEVGDLMWHIHVEDNKKSTDITGGPFYMDSSAIQELQNTLKLLLEGHTIRQLSGQKAYPVPIFGPEWEPPS